MSDNSAYTGKDPDPERIWTRQDFGRELTLVKDRAGLTVRQVARAAGLPPSTAGDYFAGRHLPGPGNPGLLARILNACGETEPARLAQWTNALIRARRQPGKRALGAGAPYRGLASFEPADARWFFGREDVTERLVELATESGAAAAGLPLVVVGASGSGKSSLLRAGLMPRLSGPTVLYVPTETPVAGLAALTAQLAELPEAEPRWAIVDQLEAVFTRCAEEDQRRAFIGALGTLAETATVILALRADFYDQALRYPELAAALQARQVVLRPMTADQVRRAIVEPARLAHLDVADGLVEVLLRDLAPGILPAPSTRAARLAQADPGAGARQPGAYGPGALPLLSHALLVTWERSSSGTITVADYLASGGISDAISRTAEGL
jgi:transcriptional regulator with XRE-family HTH domain